MVRSKRPLFTCALVTDTHLKPETGDHSTPWVTNQLANVRSRFVVQQINRADPDFIIHLGDLVHPVPALPSYGDAARAFSEIYGRLTAPLYTIPGNHDIGDKQGPWMPAFVVDSENVSAYREQFGDGYYSFDAGECRFVMINNPVFNSDLPEEQNQREWLEEELASHADHRLFLSMHYPLYLTAPDEPGHYENVDEPARSWLLSLIDQYSVEAVFAGHTHNFFFDRYAGSDLYVLPSVTSVRQDYSELFRVEPAAEYGRNDTGKFGFFMLSVYEQGYSLRFVRTAGKTLPEDGEEVARRAASPQLAEDPELVQAAAPVGVDLRHSWAEITEIPYNYILDEFQRKHVRNDYPVLALWDLGIDKLRVPVGDLMDSRVRGRMKALHTKGHQFTVFTFGLPSEKVKETLLQHHRVVDALEVIVPWEEAPKVASRLRALRDHVSFSIYLSRLETSGDVREALNKGIYYIRHGFRSDQRRMIADFVNAAGVERAVDGVAFRVGPDDDPWEEIPTIAAMADELGISASMTVQMASDDTAEVVDNDRQLANRTARTAAAAHAAGGLDVFIDTFADMDRGYFVRRGLVDRRYNPRPAGRVLKHISSVLGGGAGTGPADTYPPCIWEDRVRRFVLVTAGGGGETTTDLVIPDGETFERSGTADWYNLATGASETVKWQYRPSSGDTTVTADGGFSTDDVHLLVIDK